MNQFSVHIYCIDNKYFLFFSVFSTGALSSLSPSSRDSVDPIAELLSQLSGVRRSASNTSSGTPTQLQQLQMQLQLERQQVNATRQQLERLPRRQTQSQTAVRETTSNVESASSHTLMLKPSVAIAQPASTSLPTPTLPSNFLLAGLLEELSLNNVTEDTRLDRSQFVQELILSTMVRRKDQAEIDVPTKQIFKFIMDDRDDQNNVHSDPPASNEPEPTAELDSDNIKSTEIKKSSFDCSPSQNGTAAKPSTR